MTLLRKYFFCKQLLLLIVVYWLFSLSVKAQFAPPVGEEGSTAIKADSLIFNAWAYNCIVERGPMDISNPELGLASFGNDSVTLGIADNGVVSLGDGGFALLNFEIPIVDGPGFDFAIFENSFNDEFLELAFVEVSSDGENFFRFENTSNTQSEVQVESFGILDATKLNNLAGKYRGRYGTPFDLQEFSETPGLDIHDIIAIKIIDVVGNINDEYSTFDSQQNTINDPWPTPFESSGFDLDAIGVIHNKEHTAIEQFINVTEYSIGPNPFNSFIKIDELKEETLISIYDLNSKLVFNLNVERQNMVLIYGDELPKGILIIKITTAEQTVTKKILHL